MQLPLYYNQWSKIGDGILLTQIFSLLVFFQTDFEWTKKVEFRKALF